MRRRAALRIAVAAVVVAAAAWPALAQTSFKVPFKFESGGKKFPAGDYVVTKTGDAQVTFRQVSAGKDTILPTIQKLKPGQAAAAPGADAPSPGPALVFDEVGNFEPSYTEYFTIYVLAE